MQRVPLYATADESVKIAKKYCHPAFVKFLNASLRKFSEHVPELPQGDKIKDLSTRFSYPEFFVRELIQDYGLEQAKSIMEAENKPSMTIARIRPGALLPTTFKLLEDTHHMAIIEDNAALPEISSSKDFYIQNTTPAILIDTLSKNHKQPKKILDLCASPGGKLIAAHDCFPNAQLYANDVSEDKIRVLKENIEKYQLQVAVSCSPGENYPSSEKFDIIILDVPCSNTGVLNKRPEARWRLSKESLESLKKIQISLLDHAKTLLSEGGEIWYLTCSILKRENEGIIEQSGLKARLMKTILPNVKGWDGGFGCALKKEEGAQRS